MRVLGVCVKTVAYVSGHAHSVLFVVTTPTTYYSYIITGKMLDYGDGL